MINPLDLNITAASRGPSRAFGSGRTETAEMLFGIEPADQGEMLIGGKPFSIRFKRARRCGIASRFARKPQGRGIMRIFRCAKFDFGDAIQPRAASPLAAQGTNASR